MRFFTLLLVSVFILSLPSTSLGQQRIKPMPYADDSRYHEPVRSVKAGLRQMPVQELLPLLQQDLEDTRTMLLFLEGITHPDFGNKTIADTSTLKERELIAILKDQQKKLGELLTRCQKVCDQNTASFLLVDRPLRWTQHPGPQKYVRSGGGLTVYYHSQN